MSESGKQALLLIAITVCLVLVLNPNALSAMGRRAELPRRVLSIAEMQQFTTTANTGEIVMVGSNGVLIDQGTQAVRVGTSDVTILTGGAERLKVMNDGVVKINAGASKDALYWYNAATSSMVGGLGYSGTGDQGWIGLYDGSTQKVSLRASGVSSFMGGNVGIGVADPGYKLDVAGDLKCSPSRGAPVSWLRTCATSYGGSFNFYGVSIGTNSYDGQNWHIPSDGIQRKGSNIVMGFGGMSFITASESGGSGTLTDSEMSARTRMCILNDGNVGIGTTNPQAKLHVLDGSVVATGGFRSWQGSHYYSADTPTWSPGDPTDWPWQGRTFYITFTGYPLFGGGCIFGHFLIFHSRWSAGNNGAGYAHALVARGMSSSVLMLDGAMSFTFNAANAQGLDISVTVLAS
jgi:hypothetical protein